MIQPDWSTDRRPFRLIDGAAAIDLPDGRHLIATPLGEFIELSLDDRAWSALSDVLIGARSPAAMMIDPAHSPIDVAEALTCLAIEGLLNCNGVALAETSACPGVTALLGGSPVADAVEKMLIEEGSDVVRTTVDCLEEVQRVVACADWLPDGEWVELDQWCTRQSIPWHRSWREGAAVWIGPFSVPGSSASYIDLRLRRLAASSWPTELEALWAHLGTPSDSLRAPEWNAATVAVVAGALVSDLWAGGSADPTASAWRGYDVTSRTWHSHPVLPIPVGVRQ